MSETLCKKCRREGEKLFLKGEKCSSPRCPFTRRSYGPGHHGVSSFRRRSSEYGEQLREKQKVKRIYGIRERQFRNYFEKASKSRGITGDVLLSLLEKRLDNAVFKLGFSDSRDHARQTISHGHIKVNGRKVDISSYGVKLNDIISFSQKFQKKENFKKISERIKSYKASAWLEIDKKKVEGKVVSDPKREDSDQTINENLIVEYYSR